MKLLAVVTGTILAAAGVSIPQVAQDAPKASPAADAFDLLGEMPAVRAQSPEATQDASAFDLLAQVDLSQAAAPPTFDLTPSEPKFERQPQPSPQPAPEPQASQSQRPSSERPNSSARPSDFSLLDEVSRWDIVNSTERPIRILYFTDPSCREHCTAVDQSVLPALAKNQWIIGSHPLAHLQIVTLRDTDLFNAYGVEGMPTFVLIRDGREISRKTGKVLLHTDGYGRSTYRLIKPEEIASWYNAEVDRARLLPNRRRVNGASPAGSPAR